MCSVNKAYFSLFPILIHTFSSQQTVLFVALLKEQLFLVYRRGLLPDPSPTGPEILSGFGSGSG